MTWMLSQPIYQTYKRYRTLQTHRISTLPIVILMPHSACNCRCVMCDIWKDNQNLKQLKVEDVEHLLWTLKKFGTKQVVMSGGEALLNPKFFRLCEILKNEGIKISLLSTGITLKKNASLIAEFVNDVIVSLDGDKETHDRIRNIPGAFDKLSEGIAELRKHDPTFRISSRTVIHKLNYTKWPDIIQAAKNIGIDKVSFLPADVSSHAFNREVLWSEAKQHEILLDEIELPALKALIDRILLEYADEFRWGYVAESPEKIKKIYLYYAAFYGHNDFPFKKCNAPWVSTVVEADGNVRPCFFHEVIGNIHDESLEQILNSQRAIEFRRNLDTDKDPICSKCVCYLNLPPATNPAAD